MDNIESIQPVVEQPVISSLPSPKRRIWLWVVVNSVIFAVPHMVQACSVRYIPYLIYWKIGTIAVGVIIIGIAGYLLFKYKNRLRHKKLVMGFYIIILTFVAIAVLGVAN